MKTIMMFFGSISKTPVFVAKMMAMAIVLNACGSANAMEKENRNLLRWQQDRRLNGSSTFNKRMDFLQNWSMQNIQQNGGGQMYGGMGVQPQDSMAAAGQQIGREMVSQIQWFGQYGEMALENNRIEYQARLLRLVQIRQNIASAAGQDPQGAQIVSILDAIIDVLQERLDQTAPQNQPKRRAATPRFA